MKISLEDYLEYFPEARRAEALKVAHDIRKFEIDLYWKRATYFWTFIAAAFAGYFVLRKEGDAASVLVVSCLGFLFSLAWYFVNRGSASWQRNWEWHVDLLEDKITGPLYKIHINRYSYKFWDLADPFPFSPARINNILALCVTLIWVFLLTRTLWKIRDHLPIPLPKGDFSFSISAVALTTFTVLAAYFLASSGKARRHKNSIKSVDIHLRTYEIDRATHPPSAPR
jgi:hypothetical protein